MPTERLVEGLVVLFIAGALVFNYPLLALFDHLFLLFGAPLLYAYLFLAWLAVIILLAVIVDKKDSGSEH